MRRELRGRRVLITGASEGIGRCLAELTGRTGARLALTARSRDKLDEVATSLRARGTNALAIPADITSEDDRRRLIQTTEHHFGGLDVAVPLADAIATDALEDGVHAIARVQIGIEVHFPAEHVGDEQRQRNALTRRVDRADQ